jgi:hypothetical protein
MQQYCFHYLILYIFLFSFSTLQLSRHKIFMGITNIGGALDPFHPHLRLCFGVIAPFSSSREEGRG